MESAPVITNQRIARLNAWGAHGFTATGVVLAFLATIALFNNEPKACLLWLGAALIVDGVDGSLARKVNTTSVLPHFDGSVLDLVIDYLTYVFIPALFIYRYIPVPDYTLLLSVSVILVSSLFCFCNVDMKSKDNYFQGFPAAWNVVALCLYILSPAPWLTFITIIALALLTMTRMKFLHPFRVRRFMPLNIAVTTVWLLASALLIINHPHNGPLVMGLWLAMSAYFLGICIWRTSLEWLGRLKA
nr:MULTISPECIES: CDP-alcohol phosphatidyltransferase family protein [Pseudomonas syringae group]